MEKQVVIYSHGFGVQKDDRGLFTDIANAMPGSIHIMFNYNKIGAKKNQLTVAPFYKQRDKLAKIISEAKDKHPKRQINLICHSQGCITAALLNPEGINKTLFLAPPATLNTQKTIERFGKRPGAVVNTNGVSSFPRRDGSTTLIPPDYWPSREDIVPIQLYNELSKNTELVIVNADHDEVLEDKDFSGLMHTISLIGVDSPHDFTGVARGNVIEIIKRNIFN